MTTTYTGSLVLWYWMVGASAVVVLLLIESDTLDRWRCEHCAADDDDDEFLMVPARVNLHCVDEERGVAGEVTWLGSFPGPVSANGRCLPTYLPGRANE